MFLGNALISMYAKCGALADAQNVFDELRNKDVVSWNALAAGYLQHGCDDLVLTSFKHMQHESFIPVPVTFGCILKACGNAKECGMGKQIHACLAGRGTDTVATADGKDIQIETAKKGLFGNRSVLESVLVDMYAKCGVIELAQEVFDDLEFRDLVSWTSLMAGYCEKELGDEVLACYDQMQTEGIDPDAVTFTYILKACGSSGAVYKGIEVHAEIARQLLLERDITLSSALVDMYAKCGLVAKSEETFEGLPVKDMISWTALIGGYSEYGHDEKVLNCYERIRDKKFPLDEVAYASVMKSCGSLGALEKGEEIYAEVIRKGLVGNGTVLDGAILDMYVKCGEMMKAQQAFEEIATRDLVSWSILISGYCEQGYSDRALKCFENMQNQGLCADNAVLSCILKTCGRIGAVDLGQDIYAEIVRKQRFGNDVVLDTSVIDMYAKCGLFAKAQEIFDALSERDTVTWTTLIAAYCEHGHIKEALYCFEEMKQEGVLPNVVTMACSLKSCGSVGAAFEAGKKIHAVLTVGGPITGDTMLGNVLMDMYAKCGELEKAIKVFKELPIRDVISWNSLISSYVENGLSEDAINYYHRMSCDGVSPDAVTLCCILKACGITGAVEKGIEIHTEMVKRGLLEDCSLLGNSLIEMYSKCGVVGQAQHIFDKLLVADVVSWNHLMTGYCQYGLAKQVSICYNKMIDNGISPNELTLTCLLKANVNTGATDESKFCFTSLSASYNMIPTAEHYRCMVGFLSRLGLFDKALAVVHRMGSFDYLPAWISLLYACCSWGNSKLGSFIFAHLAQLNRKLQTGFSDMSHVAVFDVQEKG
ncbi:hypothetical protein KP509_13G062400 [Ceratopteris richardii]|nr:hypothetical protein KP509_13G062400 [Ceratopteris richardii]